MPTDTVASQSPRQLVKLMHRHRRVWVTPFVIAAVLAAGYSLVMPRKWKATQGVLIRPEVAGLGSDRLGKFADLSEMKTIQETLLELARSKTVVTQALEKVGPAPSWRPKPKWPTAQDVKDFRDAMVMTPPGGAEFGKTEIFYLGVLDKNPKRAIALTTSLTEALENRTQQIRQKQADSMIAELAEGVANSQSALNAKIEELTNFESSVGADLNDLRNLLNPIGGASESSQNNLAIKAEMRKIEAERRRNEKLLAVLQKATNDPQKLIATPSALLTSQPAVERLKQGLVDSQLNSARLLGQLSEQHPFVIAARQAELQVQQQLRGELATAISGLEIELALSNERHLGLANQLANGKQGQQNLAQHRAAYSQLVAAVENKTKLVDAARTRLADAEVNLAGAQSASVLSRIDDVESGLRPVGPGRSTIVAAGGLFGLILGVGLVFLKHGPSPLSDEDLKAVPATTTTSLQQSNRQKFGFRSPLSEAIATGLEARHSKSLGK